MRSISISAMTLSAGTVALCGLFAPAGAAPRPSESMLVITAYDGTDPMRSVIAEVTLACEPAGGTHPDAETACATLDGAGGDLRALQPLMIACPLYYQPVTIKAGGNWRDRGVNFEKEYSNICAAEAESGGIFRFATA